MNAQRFKQLLRSRQESVSGLARKAELGRSHLSQLIHGRPRRGGRSRHRLRAWITAAEAEALGWPAAHGRLDISGETFSDGGGI